MILGFLASLAFVSALCLPATSQACTGRRMLTASLECGDPTGTTAVVSLESICFKCDMLFQGGEETLRREKRNFKTVSKIDTGLTLTNDVP